MTTLLSDKILIAIILSEASYNCNKNESFMIIIIILPYGHFTQLYLVQVYSKQL